MNGSPGSIFCLRNVLKALPAFLLAFLFQACAKQSLVISPGPLPLPNPIPIHPINYYPVQTPFQAFITRYNIPITGTNSALGLSPGDFGDDTRSGMIYNEAELGFAFRSSVSGVARALGTLLPATGFTHTVTLWDSATQTILASVDVNSQSTGVFTYTNFASTVPIQANHGYVIGFNTLATGNALNTYSAGNSFFLVSGFIVDGGLGSDLPLFPFTEGSITVENIFSYNYGDGRAPANLFPPSSMWNGQPNGFFGLCDLSFVQQ
jgi:Domain of unknown function (DUF4082)